MFLSIFSRSLIFLSCLLPFGLSAQGWSPLTSGTTQILRSVYFFDVNTGWVVGDVGTILKTLDGGSNWSFQGNGVSTTLRSVRFVNSGIGWAVGDGGIILKTLDGGNAWIRQNSGTTYDLYSTDFINPNIGWAVGGNPQVVLKTINGGLQWQLQNSIPPGFGPLTSVKFIDINNGWMAGNGPCLPTSECLGSVFRTTNSGVNWANQTPGMTLNGIHFVNGMIGWTVGEGATILKTIDAGINWTGQGNQLQTTSPNLRSVYFINSDTGFFVGGGVGDLSGLCSRNPPPINCQPQAQTAMYKTTDGGVNWISQISGTTHALYSVKFPSPDVGYAVGANGTILKYNTPVRVFPNRPIKKRLNSTKKTLLLDTRGKRVEKLHCRSCVINPKQN